MSSTTAVENRAKCLLVTTCFGHAAGMMLRMSDEFFRGVSMKKYVTNRHHEFMSDFAISDTELEECEIFIYVQPGWADWGNEAEYARLVDRVSKKAVRISIPYPIFPALWPFHCSDPRNTQAAESRLTGDRVHYPYGDSYVLAQIKAGRGKEEIIRNYLNADLSEHVDLDGLLRKGVEVQRAKEAHTDAKVIDFILERFRGQRLFLTMNHMGNALLLHIVNQILQTLNFRELPDSVLHRTKELVQPELPIHPFMLNYFDITYVDQRSRYSVDTFQLLTFEEYLSNYIDFC